MSTTQSVPQPATNEAPWWAYGLLGLILLVGGFFVLGHAVLASIVTAIFFAAAMLVGGVFEIIHAFWAKGWGGFLLSLLVGLLYIVGGVVLLSDPVATSLVLTLLLAAVLIVSGIFRIVLAYRFWQRWGWILLFSGAVAIIAGLVILSGFPATGIVVLGLCLGIDLVMHGVAWMVYAWSMRQPKTA